MTATDDPVRLLASDIVGDFLAGQPAQVDPATILLLIQVAVQVITWVAGKIRECRQTPVEAAEHVRKPGLLARVRLNLGFRRHLPAELSHHRQKLVASAIRVMGRRADDELVRAFDAVPG